MKKLIPILVLLFSLSLSGCGAGGKTGDGNGNNNTSVVTGCEKDSPGAAQNSAQAVSEVAKCIYDTLDAKQDIKPYISDILSAFEVPTLGENDVTTADARYSNGLPLFFTTQLGQMYDAYSNGSYVSVDSFVDALNENGATIKGTQVPLPKEYFSFIMNSIYNNKVQFESGEVLPAFVIALGQERAKRSPPQNPDPVWGDDLLDPLQFTLLLYSVMFSGSETLQTKPVPRQTHVILQKGGGNFVSNRIRGGVTGKIGEFVEMPLGATDSAQVSVCASLLLWGHRMKVDTDPKLLYYEGAGSPNMTTVSATLTFDDDYYNNYYKIDRWMIETLTGCKLPRKGPVAGKPVEWSVSESLEEHGMYDIQSSQTDINGEAVASWRTMKDNAPKDCRTFQNQKDAVGVAIVRALNLVPGWSTLERIVGTLRDTGGTGESRIEVIYYDYTQSEDKQCNPHPL